MTPLGGSCGVVVMARCAAILLRAMDDELDVEPKQAVEHAEDLKDRAQQAQERAARDSSG
jgi:hypothetical protein